MISPGSSGSSKNGWLSRLKTGLTKTRVNIVGLFSGGVVDEEFLEELELALIGADAGVATAAHLIDALKTRIKLHGLLTQDEVRRALSDEITSLLEPAEGCIDFSKRPACDYGGRSQWRRQDDIDWQACQMAGESAQVCAAGCGRHVPRRSARAARDLGRAQRHRSDRAKRRRSGSGRIRCGVGRQGARCRCTDRRHCRALADATAFDGRIEKDQARAAQSDARTHRIRSS